MLNLRHPRINASQLPKAAAMMLFFLGLSTNGQLDMTTSWPIQNLVPRPVSLASISVPVKQPASLPAVSANDNIADPTHVLSASDAAAYRTAFASQDKSDWKAADEALATVKDRRLVGHVLADRYMRRGLSLDEGQSWMAAYADLPEAGAIYDLAHHEHGFASAHIAHPTATASWSGNNGDTGPYGFRGLESDEASTKSKSEARINLDVKINAALHRGDPIGAREILATDLQRGTLTLAEASDTISRIAAGFYYEGQIERARPLAHMAATSGVALGLWIEGLCAWKQQDFDSATRSFASLAQVPSLSPWDKAAASYWAYRGAKHIGDEPQSRHWLAEAAKYPRSFYGYMAANTVGHRASSSWKMPELSQKNVDNLAQYPTGFQALALVQIGQTDLAESELRRLTSSSQGGKHDLQTATLALAEKAHMPSLTLQMGGIATNEAGQIYEAALYPVPPWKPASGFKVDRALMFALMKRESQFDPEAVSQSGACGLMQIMPSTAHQILGEAQKSGDCNDHLFDPATNMELGQKYVRVLAGQPMIGDNLMLLLAAYNGGPGNVAHWLDGDKADPLLFLESMPVKETHDYVQQVLVHYWMYRSRLAEPENSVAQLARGEWPRYALHDVGVADIHQAAATDGLELAQR